MAQTLNDDGIVIKQTKLGEADIICTVLTRNYGKISVIAKGARKPKSKTGGVVQLFNHIDLKWTLGKKLGIIGEVSGQEMFSANISSDYDKYTSAMQMCNIIDKLTPYENEPVEQQFILILRAFRLLSDKELPELIKFSISLSYTLRSLALAGFEIDIDNPTNSGVVFGCASKSQITPALESLMQGDWDTLSTLAEENATLVPELTKIVAHFAMTQLETKLNAFRL